MKTIDIKGKGFLNENLSNNGERVLQKEHIKTKSALNYLA